MRAGFIFSEVLSGLRKNFSMVLSVVLVTRSQSWDQLPSHLHSNVTSRMVGSMAMIDAARSSSPPHSPAVSHKYVSCHGCFPLGRECRLRQRLPSAVKKTPSACGRS